MILFIDDEENRVKSCVQELRYCGYEVLFVRDVDTALQVLASDGKRVELVILDIMMPYKASFPRDATDLGLRTGVLLFERIRQDALGLPIVVFTNVSDAHVADRFRREARCWFRRKEEMFPADLAKLVAEILPLGSRN
jgi:CheY-like chemotaxis protein